MRDWRGLSRVCLSILAFCSCHKKVLSQSLDEDLVLELFEAYKNAVDNDGNSYRRVLKENKEYNIHVKRLKDVNGFKKHNLFIKEITRSHSPIIYINNPVESKIPNSFLTVDEFKKVLSNRINNNNDAYNILHEHDRKIINKTPMSRKRVTRQSTIDYKKIKMNEGEKFKRYKTQSIRVKTTSADLKPIQTIHKTTGITAPKTIKNNLRKIQSQLIPRTSAGLKLTEITESNAHSTTRNNYNRTQYVPVKTTSEELHTTLITYSNTANNASNITKDNQYRTQTISVTTTTDQLEAKETTYSKTDNDANNKTIQNNDDLSIQVTTIIEELEKKAMSHSIIVNNAHNKKNDHERKPLILVTTTTKGFEPEVIANSNTVNDTRNIERNIHDRTQPLPMTNKTEEVEPKVSSNSISVNASRNITNNVHDRVESIATTEGFKPKATTYMSTLNNSYYITNNNLSIWYKSTIQDTKTSTIFESSIGIADAESKVNKNIDKYILPTTEVKPSFDFSTPNDFNNISTDKYTLKKDQRSSSKDVKKESVPNTPTMTVKLSTNSVTRKTYGRPRVFMGG